MPRSRHKAKHIGGDKIVALPVKFPIDTLLSLFRVDQGGFACISSFDPYKKAGQNFYKPDPGYQGSGPTAKEEWIGTFTQDLNMCPSPGPDHWSR